MTRSGSSWPRTFSSPARPSVSSARAATSFDATEQSITIERTNNDASAENIGTHSLMSKDSDSKKPFRGDAVVLAKRASASVATVLAARIKDRRRPLDQGIDWLVVLPFFLRFPKAGSLRWKEELLTGLRESRDGFKQPDVDAVREQPPVPFLGPTRDPKLLARQRAGKLGEELRATYRSFEQ